MATRRDAAGSDVRSPTLPEIDRILATQDDQLRNLRVTLGYHDLSRGLARLVGYENANWCTFAVWASRQAGVFVRGEIRGIAAVRDALLRRKGQTWTAWRSAAVREHWDQGRVDPLTLLVLVSSSFGRAISEGNTRVFEDIARTFAPFIQLLEHSASTEDEALTGYLAKLSDLPVRDGGHAELRRGLRKYWEARHERDPGRRSRLVLHANCLVGYHEQTRLQREITLAMNAPIDYLRDDLDMWYVYGPGARLGRFPRARWAINSVVRRVAMPAAERLGKALWQWMATRWIMQLALPDEVLDLGNDIPRLPDRSAFPESLLTGALTGIDADLLSWLSFAYRDTLRGSRATDWTSFPERMNTICNLFRSRQQQPALFRAPFTGEQIDAIRGGEVPGGVSGPPPELTPEQLEELRAYRSP
jgi:hypothetical protein